MNTLDLIYGVLIGLACGLAAFYMLMPRRWHAFTAADLRDYFRRHSMLSARNQGLLYWFRQWLKTRAYYASRRAQAGFSAFSRRIAWETRYRFRKPYCTTCGETSYVVACFLDDNYSRTPDEYLCHDHVTEAGHCYSCGKWDFEIVDNPARRGGLCDICQADIGSDWDDPDDWDDGGWEYWDDEDEDDNAPPLAGPFYSDFYNEGGW